MKFQQVIAIGVVTILATAAHATQTAAQNLEKAVQEEEILSKYKHIDPNQLVPKKLLRKAILAFEARIDSLENTQVVSVIDYSQRSDQPRFFVIDMNSGEVRRLHVAHGKGSDPDWDGYAQKFSNTPDSLMSSLGVYVTAETYYGQHGRSLRLDGLSNTNSKARERDIVIHGASYVSDQKRIQGRSYGCPAVSQQKINKLIDTIRGGSLILAGLSKE